MIYLQTLLIKSSRTEETKALGSSFLRDALVRILTLEPFLEFIAFESARNIEVFSYHGGCFEISFLVLQICGTSARLIGETDLESGLRSWTDFRKSHYKIVAGIDAAAVLSVAVDDDVACSESCGFRWRSFGYLDD